MPSGTVYTGYTGYKFLYSDVPADYSQVYVYAGEEALARIKGRFPHEKGPANLLVLNMDSKLAQASLKGVAPACQLYADLWNMREWYAKEFVKALEERVFGEA